MENVGINANMLYCLPINRWPLIDPHLTLDHPDDADGPEDEEEVGEVRDSHPEVSRGVLIQTISQLEIVPRQKVINDSEQAPT